MKKGFLLLPAIILLMTTTSRHFFPTPTTMQLKKVILNATPSPARVLPKKDTSSPPDESKSSLSQEEERLYKLTERVQEELEVGKLDNAASIAADLLRHVECCRNNWDYGNAVHKAHIALGRFALSSGDLDAAKMQLLEPGKTPGSPQLNSFGPDRVLANELLQHAQRDTVLKYLELCSKFWKETESDQPAKVLGYWKKEITSGALPDLTMWPNL